MGGEGGDDGGAGVDGGGVEGGSGGKGGGDGPRTFLVRISGTETDSTTTPRASDIWVTVDAASVRTTSAAVLLDTRKTCIPT